MHPAKPADAAAAIFGMFVTLTEARDTPSN